MTFIYAFVSVLVVSLISLIGVFTLALKKETLQKILFFLISLAVGGLFGGAFLHLIPEVFESGLNSTVAAFLIIAGIFVFLMIEKVLHWRHCHETDCHEHAKTLGHMNLIGDSFHNFLDGVVIGAAYLVSLPVGIVATVAVILHEIPQEIGDFGVLIYSGFSVKKALFYNFLTGLIALVGLCAAFILGQVVHAYVNYIIPFAAGGFIYIAGSDLIPEIRKTMDKKKFALQLFGVALGLSLMALLGFLE
jgi:zinc and cadmium transporter